MNGRPGPGIVLDLGQVYQGPYCGFLFAAAGFDVIKVEPPRGEPLRRREQVQGGSVPFAILNAGKRDITLNLKHPAGRELLLELVDTADVLIENYAPGVLDRLGVGWDVLHERHPGLCYGSGTGYGLSGPDRDRLAMDLTVQAYGGAMSVTGFPDGLPVKAGPQIADFLGGVHLYAGLMTALFRRSQTGVGSHVEIAMQEVTLMSMASNWGTLVGTGDVGRTGNRHSGLAVAPYNVYPTKDGAIALICTAEEHWDNLAVAMGRPELADDPRYVDNTARSAHLDEVDAIVAAWTATITKEEVFAAAQRFHVPAAPVRTLVEVAEDEHLYEREALRRIDHPDHGVVPLPQSPIRFDGQAPPRLAISPGFGQHNTEVYGALGHDVDALRAQGAI
jgi:crotonobetainyl-CoA:carnitine CoA-transferase CaiB-like acyl-CoA transferase